MPLSVSSEAICTKFAAGNSTIAAAPLWPASRVQPAVMATVTTDRRSTVWEAGSGAALALVQSPTPRPSAGSCQIPGNGKLFA